MIIEWHTHVYPPEEAADNPTWDGKSGPGWGGRCPMTVENVLDAHHKAGIDVSLVSNAAHYLRGKADKEELAAIRRWTDYAAEIQDPQGHALRPCHHPALRRARLSQGGRARDRRAQAQGRVHQLEPQGPLSRRRRGAAVLELVQDLDVPVMIHPPHIGFGEERMRDYRLASSVGRPFDLCLALSRLIVRGVLEDFPRVKIVASHGGGGICEVIGRMDYAYELQDEAYFLGSYAPMKIKHPPSHYLKKMYFDTVTYHLPAARLVVETVGAGHVLYGSDAPPLTSLKPRAIKLVEDLKLPEREREAVFWRNAAGLLKLPVEGAAKAA